MSQNINYSIDKQKFTEGIRLSDAVETGDIELAKEAIESLIKKHAVIKITFQGLRQYCDSHSYNFPNACPKFTVDNLYFAVLCNYGHKYCIECVRLFIKENFQKYYLLNLYPCIYCAFYGEQNTLLLYDEHLRNLLIELVGDETLTQIANYETIKIETNQRMELSQNKFCGVCKQPASIVSSICQTGHLSCKNCIENWVKGNYEIKCFVDNCEQSINSLAIINALKDSPILINIKDKFRELGIYISFCPTCRILIKMDYSKKVTVCNCSASICNNCERLSHVESCFFYESSQEYEVIDLHPPVNPDKPKNLREQEYLNAKYAFENFLEAQGSRKFKSARLIVNKPLERRYSQKKIKMSGECGGIDKVGEVYIWHGSAYKNYDVIMRDGLKVGGVDPGVPVACGTVHGYGVYSAITPDTPIGYAKDSHWVLACLAMKGIPSTVPINDVNLLNKGNIHCYERGNWKIFFTKEQILPRFLVEYQ